MHDFSIGLLTKLHLIVNKSLFHSGKCVCAGMGAVIPALVESVYLDSVMRVFLQDLLSVFIRIERVHEHQWNIGIVCFIQVLETTEKNKLLSKNIITQVNSCFIY